MTKEIKWWRNTCERYVSFLNIMGFRDRVFRESYERNNSQKTRQL